MHPRVLAERDATVQKRIMGAAARLADHYGLEAPTAALQATHRDRDYAALQQRTAIADLLEAVADAAEQPPQAPPEQHESEPAEQPGRSRRAR